MKGGAFINRKGRDRPAKEISPPCSPEYSRKSALRSCLPLSEEQRQRISDRFWSMKTWDMNTYLTTATEANVRAVGMKYFSSVCGSNVLSFYPDTSAISAKHGNSDRETFDEHIKAKDEARAEKVRDKEAANNKLSGWTMDLQAVLLCPKTKASTLYYKTTLRVHNFTLFDENKESLLLHLG